MLNGRVLIVDDVISAGTSVRESVQLIRAAGAIPAAVVIAIDRMERGAANLSAAQEVRQLYGMPVISVATLDDLIRFLDDQGQLASQRSALVTYRNQYGVAHA